MRLSNSLLKLLNIRQEEEPIVLNLMIFQFFQGAGIAFFFTAAFSMFLEHFSVNALPNVFILAALLLSVAGLAYSWLEHRLKITQLGLIVTIIMSVSILGFRIASGTHNNMLLTLMLAWFYVLYLLNNLEFWGIASIMFDVRQSKRLFGLISSGDIPAKFIGYSLASILVSVTGVANLLYVGLCFMLFSIPFLIRIGIAGKTELETHGPSMHRKQHATKVTYSGLKNLTVNELVKRTAILAFLFSLCLFMINFIFYAEVKTAYHEDQEMAKFIALFLAGSRIFALVVKMIFTGRMLAKLGFLRSLLITPFVLAVFAILIIFSHNISGDSRIIFYIFGMMAITADILNSAIHFPGFLTLMQPLSTHDRLRAHNISKGIMDPFAHLLTGVFLLLMIRFIGHVDLIILNYILLGLLICWVSSISFVNRQYLTTLVQSITTRTFDNDSPTIVDKESLRLISAKLKDGTPLEKIYLLKLLSKNPSIPELPGLILLALNDLSREVKEEAINTSLCLEIAEVSTLLKDFIRKESDPHLKEIALFSLCKIAYDENLVREMEQHPVEAVRHAAITVILMHLECSLHQQAQKNLYDLAVSNDPNKRISAAKIIGKLDHKNYPLLLIDLIHDADLSVCHAAIDAGGKTGDERVIIALLDLLPGMEIKVFDAIVTAGELSVQPLFNLIKTGKTADELTIKLIRIFGRIGGTDATDRLEALISIKPDKLNFIIEALRKSKFKAGAQQAINIEEHINQYLKVSALINELLKILLPGRHKYSLLYRALSIEKDILRESLLDLFSFLYNPVELSKIKRGLLSGKKENVANALELIEMTIPGNIALPFLEHFEHRDGPHLPAHHNQSDLNFTDWHFVCNAIFKKKGIHFNSWTKACCFHTLSTQNISGFQEIAENYLNSENLLLKETAIALIEIN
ncbi:MAG: HEAT repeat domain-containing protein [Bacteroidota bacterium]